MASTASTNAPWPHGEFYPIQFTTTWGVGQADTGGEIKVAAFKTPFAFNVQSAYLWIAEGTWVGAASAISVRDDSSTTVIVVATLTLVTANDDGTWATLTVADAGPILQNAEIFLHYDSDTLGVAVGLSCLLWVNPVYAPTGVGVRTALP